MTSQTELFQSLFIRRTTLIQELSAKTSEYHRLLQQFSGESVLHMKAEELEGTAEQHGETQNAIVLCQEEMTALETQIADIDREISQHASKDL